MSGRVVGQYYGVENAFGGIEFVCRSRAEAFARCVTLNRVCEGHNVVPVSIADRVSRPEVMACLMAMDRREASLLEVG